MDHLDKVMRFFLKNATLPINIAEQENKNIDSIINNKGKYEKFEGFF